MSPLVRLLLPPTESPTTASSLSGVPLARLLSLGIERERALKEDVVMRGASGGEDSAVMRGASSFALSSSIESM